MIAAIWESGSLVEFLIYIGLAAVVCLLVFAMGPRLKQAVEEMRKSVEE